MLVLLELTLELLAFEGLRSGIGRMANDVLALVEIRDLATGNESINLCVRLASPLGHIAISPNMSWRRR